MSLLQGCSSKLFKGCLAGVGCFVLLAVLAIFVFHRACRARDTGPATRPSPEAPAQAG